MRSLPCAGRLGWVIVGMGVLFLAPEPAWPQGQLGAKDALSKAFGENGLRRSNLVKGEEQATKADASIAEAFANWYLYRLTHVTGDPVKIHTAFSTEIANLMDLTVEKKARPNRAYIDLLGPALVRSTKDVLANRDVKISTNQACVIHTAAMLPVMAKLKQSDINDYLAELIEDKATDNVVRLYAMRAFKEAMPVYRQPDDLELFIDKDKKRIDRDSRYVGVLTNYIIVKANADSADIGDLAAVRFMRREAIIALGQAGTPAVLAGKLGKNEITRGMVAPTLLNVMAGNVQPPPSLQEKIEAAIGACAMKKGHVQDYDSAVTTYLIGKTIMEFVTHYNTDFQQFAVSGKGRKLPYLAYKNDALRLREALKQYSANVGETPAANNLQTLTYPILDRIAVPLPGALYSQPEALRVNALRQWLTQKPASGKIFPKLKVPEINPLP
ncbi:MAG: hypothetical protein HYR84_06425 [Planctomycetes bacterium]|nr:hypothetical protein [Planctomycetota bacterium]